MNLKEIVLRLWIGAEERLLRENALGEKSCER
jgi:hypothetical protein